ncbi:MAG: Phosphoglycerate kinase [Legionellaceae bacterium]
MLTINDVDLANKRVLIREDFNVPLKEGKIVNDARIKAALPTIQLALQKGAKIILMSHLGRPTEGENNLEFSLMPIATHLSELLQQPVHLFKDDLSHFEMPEQGIVLLENIRFQIGEKKNDPVLAKKLAALCDVFIMDAFATAHRAEASTCGVAKFVPLACAGLLLSAEVNALKRVMLKPAKPLLAIVGGAKVSTKLVILNTLLEKVDQLIVGGGIANTFLAAAGYPIGQSLYEAELIPEAKVLLQRAQEIGVSILLPQDVVTALEFSSMAEAQTKMVNQVKENDRILDVGPKTIHIFEEAIKNAHTILWNGPVGAFELTPFKAGTKAIALAVGKSQAFSVVGGGDTLAAIDEFHITENISYISTGGGAFLEFIEGKTLPAIAMLEECANV